MGGALGTICGFVRQNVARCNMVSVKDPPKMGPLLHLKQL